MPNIRTDYSVTLSHLSSINGVEKPVGAMKISKENCSFEIVFTLI